MPNCPQCENLVTSEAIKCPHCGVILKAYGHQGIPLHQVQGEASLCDRCLYHEDDTCTYPQRPYAKTCIMYCDRASWQEDIVPPLQGRKALQFWCRQNRGLLLFLGVILVSLFVALLNSTDN
ncbi:MULTISPECIES: zinc ribbon domain-containing protein [Spirulina sp. CCY15215]|uniref:zinc ribbon domain-containing protein n=1 Tax=Spirulina sp. CCY15215 TaxID=2767591 RepID=UPI00194E742A|nr:zinc ribbon domain-containing protein [Spirulina major]